MDVFKLRDQVIEDYSKYVRSFLRIRDERIREYVEQHLDEGMLWPDPLVQLNPSYAFGPSIDDLVGAGKLHPLCQQIFRIKREDGTSKGMRVYVHQEQAIDAALEGDSYVLTTGTGSGKSLAYIIPIVNHVLRRGSGKGIQALIVYPMNALANS
ncbi:MAG: DEAD/DEAH box helicase, partial [Chloroflexi bacterium]|nr:DEAD/DEAH box helicase [Chloroflexota bacterium]